MQIFRVKMVIQCTRLKGQNIVYCHNLNIEIDRSLIIVSTVCNSLSFSCLPLIQQYFRQKVVLECICSNFSKVW